MQDRTHFWFAFSILLLDILFLGNVKPMIQMIFLPLVVILSFSSNLPNILDKYLCLDQKTKTCSERCRHPITHGLFVLLILFVCILEFKTDNQILYLFVRGIFLSIGSHLFLDVFSEEGIPVGLNPTLFYQDKHKNYLYNQYKRPRLKVHFFNNFLLRDKQIINNRIVQVCKGVVIACCLFITIDLIRNSLNIEERVRMIHKLLNGLFFQSRGLF